MNDNNGMLSYSNKEDGRTLGHCLPSNCALNFNEDIPTQGIKKQSWETFTVEAFTARAATISPLVKRKWIDIDNQLLVQ